MNAEDLKVGMVVKASFLSSEAVWDQEGYLLIQDMRPWPYQNRDRGRIQLRGLRVGKDGLPDKRFKQADLSHFTFADRVTEIVKGVEG